MIGAPKRPARAALLAACAVHFVHDGFSDILYVLLPLWAGELGLGLAQVGIIRTGYTGGMALFQIPAGLLAERWGERAILAMGTAVTALAFVAAGWTGGYLALLGALLLAGLGSGVQHPLSSSIVSRAYETGARRAALGTYNFAGDLGKVVVPAAVALAATLVGWRWATTGYGLLGVLAAVLIPLAIAAAPRAPVAAGGGEAAATRSAWGIRDARGFQALSAIGMIDNAARTALLTFLPFALLAKGVTVAGMGGALALVFAGGALGKFVCGLVAERVGVIRTVVLTETATAVLIVTVLVVPPAAALVVLFPLGIALNGTSSVLYATVADLVTPERRARAYGLYYSLSVGASALAPSVFGLIGDQVGVPATLTLVALLTLVAVPLSLTLRATVAEPARA